nr:bifunctional lysylphosphatidylglycerol synthetase/lysine--tRNA ligase LysX [Allorhizocola rhizosphaerae]
MYRWVPRFFAAFLTAVAILCALASLRLGHGTQPVRRFIDAIIVPAPPNLAYAAFVGLLAAATARRKRVAWWIMLAYFGLQLVADVILLFPRPETMTIASLVITVALLAPLLVARKEFYARVQRASLPKAIGVFVLLSAVFLGIAFLLAPNEFGQSVGKFFGGYGTHGHRWGNFLLGLAGATTLLASAYTLFRTQRQQAVLHPDEEVRVRQLLAEYGERDSLGYFATRRDKSVVFAPNGKAAVTYRAVAGVGLASADPIGEPESWGPAIEAWLAYSRSFGWRPAVMGASEEGAYAYSRHGLKVIELGDEAVLEVRDFELDGRDMRPVRQAVRRIERLGYTARIRRHSSVPDEEMKEAARLADVWRDTDAERGFSMALSRLDDPWDGQCVLVEALDAQGKPAAILSFVPWGRKGLSLDLMRRDRDADNGLMEFMVASLVKEAPRLGVERISLNFAVFRSAFEEGARIGAGPVKRAWRHLLLFLSRWWQLESLYRSNMKYQPRWAPRFLCFGERRELATIGLAAAIAEGFLVLPWRRGQLTPAPPPSDLALPIVEERPAPSSSLERPEQVRVRMAKARAYPVGYPRTHTCLQARAMAGQRVAVAGRVMLLRDHGRIVFATLRDWSGDIQIVASSLDVDIGDHIGVSGVVGGTDKGEISVFADDWELTAKCLQPLPNKHRGLTDPEARVRQRYLDLIMSPASRDLLKARSAVVHSLRQTLHGHGFLEVETPMLQPIHGGANARPFVTHINVYDMRLYLRIAPELYLKRLCVGGVERVFELGRTFRNEGVSFKHNPEFTMLEAYHAYADYMTMLELARTLIQTAALAASEFVRVEHDLGGDWPVVSVHEAISRALGEPVTPSTPVEMLRKLASQKDIPYNPDWGRGEMILELYERLVEHATLAPTFYKDFPTDVSPLTREHRDDPRLAERWDLVAFGTELGTAYSELIDPLEQRARLTAQSLKAAGGDPEAMELDEDFLEALEYAMPPTGGLGIGVDRLVMLLTGKTIRETLPFPLVRPR